jgi:hypothetical protein
MTIHPVDGYNGAAVGETMEAHAMTEGHEFDRQSFYRIRVKGSLDSRWSDWFDGFTINPQANDETLLVGRAPDQAALHGLLAKIRDLGLPLLSVKRGEDYPSAQDDGEVI